MVVIKGLDTKMIAKNLTPFELTHLGSLLKEENKYRGISQKKLAVQTDISYAVLNEVLNCKRHISSECALLFEAAFADIVFKMNISIKTVENQMTYAISQIRKQLHSWGLYGVIFLIVSLT